MNKFVVLIAAFFGIGIVLQVALNPFGDEPGQAISPGVVNKICSEKSFDELVEIEGKLILLNFWSNTCPPSLNHESILAEVAKRYRDDLLIANINVDENLEVGLRCGISRIPTLVFLRDRLEVKRSVGVHDQRMMFHQIENLIPQRPQKRISPQVNKFVFFD